MRLIRMLMTYGRLRTHGNSLVRSAACHSRLEFYRQQHKNVLRGKVEHESSECCRITDDAAGTVGHQGRHSRPGSAHQPQPYAPEWYKARNAVERGPRLAQEVMARGRSLRQIRAALLGFSVLGSGLDLAEIRSQHYLINIDLADYR